MAVNTGQPFCNTTDGYLCEGTDVRGSYFVIDEIKNIPNEIAKIGSLCFCTSDSKFYQYQITSEPNAEKVTYGWVEVKFEADLQDYAKTQDIIDGNIIAGKAEKDGNGKVIHNTYQTKITETNKLDYKYIKNLPESSGITQGQLDDQLKTYQTKNLSSPITINGQAESTVEGAIDELNTQKVNVVKGKGLSTNDLTNELLEQLQDKYTKNEINTNYYNIKQITPLLNDKANTNDLKALAYKDSITKQDIGLGNVNNVAITQEQVNQIGTNKQSIENINTANITRDQNISNAQVTANEAKLIAEGKSRTSVFETLEALKSSLKNGDATQFKVGDNLYIKATDVPDYWISNVLGNNSGEYGYYEISPLETAKVDLSQYQPLITHDNKLSYNLLKDTPTIPTKLSELEQDIEIGGSDGVTEEDVMNIIEENSTEVATLNIGTSTNYNEESDNEIPTTLAVKNMIDKGGVISLGEITYPGIADHEQLNAITTPGIYTFTTTYSYSGGTHVDTDVYFMVVEKSDIYDRSVEQFIYACDIAQNEGEDASSNLSIIKRIKTKSTGAWSVSSIKIPSQEYIDEKLANAGIPEIVVTGDVAEIYDINPNNYYTFEGINNNNFIINLVGDTQGFVNEYKGQICVDENPLAITFPSSVRWKVDDNVSIGGNILTFNPKFTYLYSILNNIGIIMSIENEALATPVLTLTDSTISWDAVPNADSYDIYVNDELLTNTTATYIDLSLHLLEVSHYDIKVKANSNKYPDSISGVIRYTISKQLDTPTGLVLNDSGVLTWDTVENANGYKVFATPVGDVGKYTFYSGTNNYADLTKNTNPSLTGKTCTIRVIACNTENTAYLDSNSTESIEYTFADFADA